MAEAEEIPRDDVLKFNIKAYLPYICECVEATHLLVHLHYFTKEQRKEIFKMCGQNNVAATRRALEILLYEKDDPGRFTAIRDAIKTSEYPKIVQMLDGNIVPCDANCQKIIELFANEIIRRLNPEELLPKLVSQSTITASDAEEVRAEERNHGKRRACWVLLFHLPNRAENWFRNFFDALLDYDYSDIAELLDPDLFNKIMEQRKAASSASSLHGIDDTRENILTDDNFDSMLEKEDLEQPEKSVKESSNDNYDNLKDFQKTSKKIELDSLLKGIDDLKMTGQTACKQLMLEDVTDGKMRNKEGDDVCDSLTIEKRLAQGRDKRSSEPDKRIQYDREFLLACKDSPLTKLFPREVEKFPEIMVLIKLPRRSDTGRKLRNDQGSGICDSQTEAKVLEQNGKARNDKRIQYDKEFLLACKDSPLTKFFPKEVEKFPEIMVPIKLPRRSERLRKGREDLSARDSISDTQLQTFTSDAQVETVIPDTQVETVIPDTQVETVIPDTPLEMVTSTDVIYENNFEDVDSDGETVVSDGPNEGLLDFDSLLADNTSPGSQEEDAVSDVVNNDRQEAEGPTESVVEASSDLHEERGAEGFDEILYTRHVSDGPDYALNINFDNEELVEDNMVAMAFPEQLNDLGIGMGLYVSDETEFNIATDADEVDAEDEDIPLREYQKELAKEGSEGDNVIVMAPTNTGKTRVACRIMQVHLRSHRQAGKIGKVIFLVENEALATQQGEVCAKLLPAYRTKVISGSIQRDKKQYLRDFVGRRDILVVTAQVLLNALKTKEINGVTTFSLIVFDECHHTDNEHRFNEIMGQYMELKLRQHMDAEQLPQIVGLTASLGVGGNTKHDPAMNHMKGLLANLDAKFLCTVRKNKEELRYFENNPIEEMVPAKKRKNDLYRTAILDIVDIIQDYMVAHQSMETLSKKEADNIRKVCSNQPCCGSEQFMQWQSTFKKEIAKVQSDSVRRMLNPCRLHLEVYNKALMIHADARIKDATIILNEFMEKERQITPKNETDVMLLELYDNMKMRNFNRQPENPKLVEMERIVMDIFNNNEDARGIIFVKTRELAQALVNWMKETVPLDSLHATDFVGQVASKADGGMTKCGQKDVLEYFKGGRHKIIIATSVAEEGLDITKCNLVIRYEHVTNEIVRLQSRGRARQQNSRYYVLTEEGSWIVGKEEKNALLEKVMNIIVPKLQAYIEDGPNLWEQELRQIQEEQKQLEELKEKQRLANMSNDDHEFRCLNCGHFVCLLSDIRKIKDAHHVAIDEEVPKRLISVRNPHPRFMFDELKFDGSIYCGNQDCQRELGGVCEYKHAEFPLLKIKNFRVVDKNDKGNTFKKWKKANFVVQPFTLDDLREVVERRRADI